MYKISDNIIKAGLLAVTGLLTATSLWIALQYAGFWGWLLLLLSAVALWLAIWLSLRLHKHGDLIPEEPIGWRQGDRQLLGFIERMLKGCSDQRITPVQIPTRSPFFFVLGCEIAALQGVDKDDTEQYARKEMQVCNVLSEIFAAHSFWPMNIDGLLICVINLRAEPGDPLRTDALQRAVMPLLNTAVMHLQEEGITVRFSVSDMVVGVENLSPAYYDVVDVFDQLILRHEDINTHIILAEPERHTMSADHITRAKTEKLFTNYTLSQDFSNAKVALLRLTEYELQDQAFSVTIKRMTSNRLEWTMDTLSDRLSRETVTQLRETLKTIAETNYIQDLTRLIEAWFDILSTRAEAPAGDTLIPKVQSYIQENCLDSELSVALISRHFSVNPSYLSNTFHHQTGVRLIDFIHHHRLTKVKELLRETDLPVAKIAECTGYYSAISMSRAFKRYEGITPTAYRNS